MTATIRPAPDWAQALAALLERALWTWAQAFIVVLLGSTFFTDLNYSVLLAAAVSTIPAALTVLVAAVDLAKAPDSWPPFAQAAFRVIRTWVATFLGFLAAATWVVDLQGTEAMIAAAAAAAGAALLAAIKAELATHVGFEGSVATLPVRFDAAAVAWPKAA